MHICIYTYIHIYIYTYIHIYIYTYIHIHIYTYIHCIHPTNEICVHMHIVRTLSNPPRVIGYRKLLTSTRLSAAFSAASTAMSMMVGSSDSAVSSSSSYDDVSCYKVSMEDTKQQILCSLQVRLVISHRSVPKS